MKAKPKRKLVNFRIREDLSDRLQKAAEFKDVSQSHIVREAVEEKVSKIELEVKAELAEVPA